MTNRLIHEVSPYLQQHAQNPVDWHAWNDEALARARAEDKPILLSIGYSACHWCHVMEHESFSDAAIAAQMNAGFINIKVDREERPDLDQIYQLVVQLMGRSGGWPLTVVLTPTLKPFFGGTYFPNAPRYGMPSFSQVLDALSEAYRERRDEIEASAVQVTGAISDALSPRANAEQGDVPRDVLAQASARLLQRHDDQHGGFGSRPKFPNTMSLDVLVRELHRTGRADLRHVVVQSLDAMREGGIHDQLGGGFHRYSTDERWLVPHFEKMLYDNALLLRAYVDGWRVTRESRFVDIVRETVAYVQREMTSPHGGFYASQDADSEGEEGTFFVWTPQELRAVLDDEAFGVAMSCLGVTEEGNFEGARSVLHLKRAPTVVEQPVLQRAKARLFAAREQRPKPFRDEKVIVAWNALMVGALADAGGALGEATWVNAARDALWFIRDHMQPAGELHRIHKDGQLRQAAFLDDYAGLACAALDVYENTFDPAALAYARQLLQQAIVRFWDEDSASFYLTAAGATDLLVRPRDSVDNAVPSGVSLAVHALMRLGAIDDDATWLPMAERALRAMGSDMVKNPFGHGHLLCAADRYLRGATEVVIVGGREAADTVALALVARQAFAPNRTLLLITPSEPSAHPLRRTMSQRDGKATAYVCQHRACSAPVTTPDDLRALLATSA